MSVDRGRLGRLLAIVFFVVLLAGAITRGFVLMPLPVQAGEMAPALFQGDTAIVVRTATPVRGDIIAFEHPQKKGVTAARRIVGVPGDTVALKGQKVILNGAELPRTKLGPLTVGDKDQRTSNTFERWREEGPGRGWDILLDPRRRSPDFGPVEVKEGFFVLADSRNHGRDSREYGLVPAKNVKGVVRYLMSATPVKELGVRPSRIP
ncbi:MAG TPA: signal peptidase I [Polyangia bacterium]|jgi:signal peptidase I